MLTYKVRPGDTIWKIARKFHIPAEDIVRLNRIRNPDRIAAGATLVIPETTTDSMDAVVPPVEAPPSVSEPSGGPPVNRTRFRLPAREYCPEVTEKDLIVLHFTAGGTANGAFETWMNHPARVATAYMVDLDGTIYELFDPAHWAWHLGVKGGTRHEKRSMGVEIVNVGPLKPSPRNPGQLNWWPNEWSALWCRVEEEARYVRAGFRGIDYFAAFPEIQMEAVGRLVSHLCERFRIRKTVPPVRRRQECDTTYFSDFKGVASHQNFRKDKWGVGPAFVWDRLGL